MNKMRTWDWGLIEYAEALERQLAIVEEVIAFPEREGIVFCSHPPVVTLGKKSTPLDVQGWTGPVFPVQRGGRATYHGPGQLVIYPILHLGHRHKDLFLFLRQLEKSIILTLLDMGINSSGGSSAGPQSEALSRTGVWFGERKVASIGVAVKRWVSYHGAAINLEHDPLAFSGISPCGYSPDRMISLEEVLKRKVDKEEFKSQIMTHLIRELAHDIF